MRLIPWWALLSSGCAPVVLIGGWVTTGLLRGSDYNPVTDTISALEADGAPGRWLMVSSLAALGICHLVTAIGLRAAVFAGRVALAGGGVASFLVAMFPQPLHGGSFRHGVVTVLGFSLLCVWPYLAAVRGRSAPWGLRPVPSIVVTLLMLAGAWWFLVALNHHGAAGVAERLVTATQALWPFAVAVSCVRFAPVAAAGALDQRRRQRR
ncbi:MULTISPECIES: DUF998 domain-containing protein [unclassified Kitasatospora]|uniref:DUF998 domain-containing protein n=1 Tax=unclassified Kitasatospora TaxID=2633591 RepID=UPI0024738DD8|nr:DUF998 domain-containing protein [Kitasatospora sp. MAP12-44]